MANCGMWLSWSVDPSAFHATRQYCFAAVLCRSPNVVSIVIGASEIILFIEIKKFTRKQFPVDLSCAWTINKSQGKTIHRMCVYLVHILWIPNIVKCHYCQHLHAVLPYTSYLLTSVLFARGQLYAAFSRETRTTELTVLVNSDAINEDGTATVTNVVWPELPADAPAQADPLLINYCLFSQHVAVWRQWWRFSMGER